MKKSNIFLIIILIIVLIFIGLRFLPTNILKNVFGDNNPLACSYSIKVVGDSMEPYLSNGDLIFFNKCFNSDDLIKDTIIAFKEKDIIRIGIIQENTKGKIKAVQSNRSDRIFDILEGQIIAIKNNK